MLCYPATHSTLGGGAWILSTSQHLSGELIWITQNRCNPCLLALGLRCEDRSSIIHYLFAIFKCYPRSIVLPVFWGYLFFPSERVCAPPKCDANLGIKFGCPKSQGTVVGAAVGFFYKFWMIVHRRKKIEKFRTFFRTFWIDLRFFRPVLVRISLIAL